jgi:hypothetical protein
MKRCPQCEFIYEDNQTVCDMDGQSLLHDHALSAIQPPSSPGKPAKRSSLGGVALPAGAGLLLAVAIFIGSTASPSALQTKTEGATAQTATQQLEASAPPQNDLSLQSTGSISAVEPVPLESSEPVPAANPEPNALDKTVHAHIRKTEERFPIARSVPPLPRLRPLPRLPEVRPLETKPGSTMTGRTSQRSAQPKESNSAGTGKKDSKLGSFLKKTGRVLSKPFKL